MDDIKDWKRQLAKLLREHPAIESEATGQIEINLNRGSITKLYRVTVETKDEGAVRITTRQELK